MSKGLLRLILFAFYFLQVSQVSLAKDAVFLLHQNQSNISACSALYIFEDVTDTLEFSDVETELGTINFKLHNSSEEPNFGFTNSSFWFRLTVKNTSQAGTYWLEIPYPFLNFMEVYLPDSMGNYQRHSVGDHLPFSKRKILHKNFLFEMDFSAGEQKVIYAHISCNGEATSFPVNVLNTLDWVKRDYVEQVVLGGYYGILIFAFFLSFFLGISLKEKVNFYYLLYIIGIGIFQFSLDGLAFQYLWPNNHWLANHIIPMSGSFAVFFLLLFSQQLLQTKKLAPAAHQVISFLAIADAVLHFMSLFNNPFYSLSLKSLNLIALIANSLVLITAIIVFRKKQKSARYFLIAFTLLIVGVLLALLKNFGYLPRIFITEYGIQMGSAIEIILLSFALAENVKTLKEEKQLVQELLLEQLTENNKSQIERNIELENKVLERTLEIKEQTKIIAEKNKDITDSINYAKRIQQAILPPEETGELKFPMFIYFKPRDIVSGDFYWYEFRDNKLIIAAVDCTGHGVPGAFMSMVGTTLLNKVVNDLGQTLPSQIMKQMDINILESLKQRGDISSNRDGMDMAICTIDSSNRELIFSGASRPLYLVRNNELTEYKSSIFSVGGYLAGNEKVFEDAYINYQSNDMIYIFSDGYADQFGGEKGKKFMSKNMRLLFSRIASLPLDEQKSEIHSNLIAWMGSLKQVDDILVIGIRL
jgi:serine phosphatase RsbU (regulator of sigma subunit)